MSLYCLKLLHYDTARSIVSVPESVDSHILHDEDLMMTIAQGSPTLFLEGHPHVGFSEMKFLPQGQQKPHTNFVRVNFPGYSIIARQH